MTMNIEKCGEKPLIKMRTCTGWIGTALENAKEVAKTENSEVCLLFNDAVIFIREDSDLAKIWEGYEEFCKKGHKGGPIGW